MTATEPALEAATSPLKFLDYFTRQDQERFHGRADDIERVSAGIVQHRTFVLYGASGSGKTSLLLAGVFPELERRGYIPIYVRTLADPQGDLRDALTQALHAAPNPAATVEQLVAGLSAQGPVVLVFDQFEEFFIRFREQPDKRHPFIQLLADLVNSGRLDVRVAFSLRQEWLGEMEDLRGALPDLFSGEYRLHLLTAFGARQAIASQLEHAGVDYEPRLLLRLVDTLEGYGFDPTILQLVCSELYRRAAARDADRVSLTTEDLTSLGGVPQIFRGLLDSFAASLPEEAQLTARAVLDALTTRERTKHAVTVGLVAQSGYRASPAELRTILEALRQARLVRKETRVSANDPAGGASGRTEDWFELVHERLVSVIEEWLGLDRMYHEFRMARDLVTNSARFDAWRANPEVFPTREALDGIVRPFSSRLSLSTVEEEYLFRCAVYRQSAHLPEWAARLDVAARGTYLRQLLGDKRAEVRVAAVQAVQRLAASEFAGQIARLVFEDEAAEVRAAAGNAMATVGTEPQKDEFAKALTRSESRSAAREALVRLHESGAALPRRLSLIWAWRIRREARRRVLQANRDAILSSIRNGAIGGVRAAIVWTAAVGFPATLLTANGLGYGGDPSLSLAGFGLIVLLVALALGAVYGSLIAYSIRRQIALKPRRRPFWLSFNAGRRLFNILMFGFAVFALLDGGPKGVAIVGAFWVAGSLLKAGLAGLGSLGRLAQVGSSGRRVWAWRLAATTGIPFLVIASAAAAANHASPEDTFRLWPIAAALASFLALHLACHQPQPKSGNPARRGPARARIVVVAVAALNVVSFFYLFGWDTLPLVAHRASLEGGAVAPLHGRIGPGIPDADYYRLSVSGAPLTVARLRSHQTAGNGPVNLRLGGQPHPPLGDTAYALLPRGDHWLAVTFPNGELGSYDLELHPAMSSGTISDEWQFVALTLTADANARDTLRGTVSGRLERMGPSDAVQIKLFSENPATRGSTRFSAEVQLFVPDPAGDTVLIGELYATFAPGPKLPWSGDFPSTGSGSVAVVPADSTGAWSLLLRMTPPQSYGVALAKKAPGLLPDSLTIAVGVRRASIDLHDYITQLLDRAARPQRSQSDYGAEGQMRAAVGLSSRLAGEVNDPLLAHEVCRFGALNGFAREVLPTCNHALQQPGAYGEFRVTRAIALAQAGLLDSARSDLQFFIHQQATIDPNVDLTQCREWLRRLQQGVNPFAEELDSLKTSSGGPASCGKRRR